ncbi:hypothetical protein BJF83_13125 [Nocardiopsis sp. CNR-923]|uniref:hypothetical protein n=1 Tax=Nocardiopsis sp. CNR-923 TaxID=1904965 RepID=UPI0009603BD9|nr:hypothetical protein [Nocardiopsis sp. CNR-923]OLT29039.1 hypothetical protein BJF83_13125 [Nocardiopsis sp. CNR-923]
MTDAVRRLLALRQAEEIMARGPSAARAFLRNASGRTAELSQPRRARPRPKRPTVGYLPEPETDGQPWRL